MFLRIFRRQFYSTQAYQNIPKLSLSNFLVDNQYLNDCSQVAKIFKQYGCIIVEDPRVHPNQNMNFLATMKTYFEKRQQQIDRGQVVDVYKQFQYEIGLTPPKCIVPYDESEKAKKFSEQHRALTPFPLQPMKALRYLWNVGNVAQQIPSNRPPVDFPNFQTTMDEWGNTCLNTAVTVTEMLQLGLGLNKGTFSQKLIGGPHKLGPLGFDLTRCNLGEAFANVHDDFAFMTIHGRSTFPGLFVWTPSGQKIKVRTPPGCFLLQAGIDLQYLTGGYIESGVHESIYTDQVHSLVQKDLQEGKHPWRLTSTMFLHLNSNSIMKPQGHFLNDKTIQKYPAVRQHDHMMKFLKSRPRF